MLIKNIFEKKNEKGEDDTVIKKFRPTKPKFQSNDIFTKNN